MPSMLTTRAAFLAATLAVLVTAALLLWSDRAPGLIGAALDRGVILGRRIEHESGLDVIDRDDLPSPTPAIAHAAFWGAATLALAAATWRRVPLSRTVAIVTAVSTAYEMAQPFVTATRRLELADIGANVCGIGIAALAVGAFTALHSMRGSPRSAPALRRVPQRARGDLGRDARGTSDLP